MEWWVILIIVLAAPLLLLPTAVIWYVNLIGIYHGIKRDRGRAGKTAASIRIAPQKAH